MSDTTIMRVTANGQVSLPALVRHRWNVQRVQIIDEGDRLVLVPVPDDPLGAAMGALKGSGMTADELREQYKREDATAGTHRRR